MVIYFIQLGEGIMPFGFRFPRIQSVRLASGKPQTRPSSSNKAVCFTEASPTDCNTRPQAPQGISSSP